MPRSSLVRQRDVLPSLDGIRAVCIALVVGAHLVSHSIGFPQAWVRPVTYFVNAGLGVRAFFVLSGFLISYLLSREETKAGRVDLRAFYARRLLRIVPVCYAYVAVLALLDHFTRVNISACGYATSLLYLRDVDLCGDWLYGHLWSLSVEEQFYLLWPCVIALAPRRARFALASLLVVASPLCRLWWQLTDSRFNVAFSFLANVDGLMIGSVVGLAFSERSEAVKRFVERRPGLGRAMAFAAIAIVWVFSGRLRFAPLTVSLGTSLQAAAIAYLVVSYVVVRRGLGFALLNLRPVRYVGVLSYSIYVWQQMIMVLPGTYSAREPFWLVFPLNLVTVFAAAAASYHLFEKPLLKLRSRLRRDDRAPEPAAAPVAAATLTPVAAD